MNAAWIVIDGSNLVHQAPVEMVGDVSRDFVTARQRLARYLDKLAGSLAKRVTIIFDGTIAGRDEHFDASSVEVVFCDGVDTADAMIERTAAACAHPETMLVVTSDRAERETVEAHGVQTTSCAAFLDLVAHARTNLGRAISSHRSGARKTTLGDFFPAAPRSTS